MSLNLESWSREELAELFARASCMSKVLTLACRIIIRPPQGEFETKMLLSAFGLEIPCSFWLLKEILKHSSNGLGFSELPKLIRLYPFSLLLISTLPTWLAIGLATLEITLDDYLGVALVFFFYSTSPPLISKFFPKLSFYVNAIFLKL